VAAIIAHSPDEEESFLLWLKSAGFGDGSRPRVKHLGNAEFPFENTTLDIGEIDQKLRALEKKFANNDNVYVAAKVNAIIRRDGPLINALKKKYDYQCQFPSCNTRIQKKNGGYYCEVGHVLAVAKGGVASRINLLVLCPNHHKAVDYGATTVLENTGNWLKIELNGEIVTIKRY
jgi:predicted restriction endonuclease